MHHLSPSIHPKAGCSDLLDGLPQQTYVAVVNTVTPYTKGRRLMSVPYSKWKNLQFRPRSPHHGRDFSGKTESTSRLFPPPFDSGAGNSEPTQKSNYDQTRPRRL
jgi:hypothetical protein